MYDFLYTFAPCRGSFILCNVLICMYYRIKGMDYASINVYQYYI